MGGAAQPTADGPHVYGAGGTAPVSEGQEQSWRSGGGAPQALLTASCGHWGHCARRRGSFLWGMVSQMPFMRGCGAGRSGSERGAGFTHRLQL